MTFIWAIVVKLIYRCILQNVEYEIAWELVSYLALDFDMTRICKLIWPGACLAHSVWGTSSTCQTPFKHVNAHNIHYLTINRGYMASSTINGPLLAFIGQIWDCIVSLNSIQCATCFMSFGMHYNTVSGGVLYRFVCVHTRNWNYTIIHWYI